MTSLSLCFRDTTLDVIMYDQKPWISSRQLGQMLGYAREDAVNKVFERKADEFSSGMTCNVKMTLQGQTREVRVFSLRGCHLIAMFAKTPVAQEFRKWVLDILDKEVGQPVCKTHKSEREPLTNAVNMLVSKTKHLSFSDAYKLVHQRFNVDHIGDIPYDAIPVAVEYVHHLIALYSNADKKQQFDSKYIESLARHALWLNHWWADFGGSIRKISPAMGHGIHDHFTFAAEDAKQIVGREVYMPIFELAQSHDWHKGGMGYNTLKEVGRLSVNN